jgi:uncharacterized Rmd1/YagE family protein
MSEKRSQSYVFHAYHLAEALKLKAVDRLFDGRAIAKSSTNLVYQEGESQYFFIYRFGSIIFFNVDARDRESIVEKMRTLTGERAHTLVSEDFAVRVGNAGQCSVGFESACIDALVLDRLELLAFILAQSTALEYFEYKVDEMLSKTADIGFVLRRKGRLERRVTQIKKFMGECITTKQELVASLYLLDKPDATWDDQALDNLYREAAEMFELKDRYKTVDYKLRMIQENLELIADLLQYRYANHLEWAIILLIAIEIVLFVFQLFVLEVP